MNTSRIICLTRSYNPRKPPYFSWIELLVAQGTQVGIVLPTLSADQMDNWYPSCKCRLGSILHFPFSETWRSQ